MRDVFARLCCGYPAGRGLTPRVRRDERGARHGSVRTMRRADTGETSCGGGCAFSFRQSRRRDRRAEQGVLAAGVEQVFAVPQPRPCGTGGADAVGDRAGAGRQGRGPHDHRGGGDRPARGLSPGSRFEIPPPPLSQRWRAVSGARGSPRCSPRRVTTSPGCAARCCGRRRFWRRGCRREARNHGRAATTPPRAGPQAGAPTRRGDASSAAARSRAAIRCAGSRSAPSRRQGGRGDHAGGAARVQRESSPERRLRLLTLRQRPGGEGGRRRAHRACDGRRGRKPRR